MNETTPPAIKLNPEPEEYIAGENAFLCAVGVCITQWAFIDRQLFRLFRRGIGAATFRAAIVYYDQHTISQRLRQVDGLLKELFEPEEHNELRSWWDELHKRISDLLPTRNIIAHQPVRRLGTLEGGKPVYIYGIHIEPYQRYLKKTYKGMKGKDMLRTEDLNTHAEEAAELHAELASFAKKVVRAFRD